MVNFNINIEINDIIAESSAVTLLYVNGLKICSLSDENIKFSGDIPISDNKVSVLLKSVYSKNHQTPNTKNPLKRIIAYIILFILTIFSTPEPLECPYEYEENIEITINGNCPSLFIKVSKPNVMEQPQIYIENKDSSIKRTSKCYINHIALKEIFSKRKRVLTVFSLVPTVVLLGLALLCFFYEQYTNLFFLILITVLIIAVFIYSRHNLTKQYMKYIKMYRSLLLK